MRFLIFNLLVLSSLAYLVTAPPGMSPTKWAREFPDTFKNLLEGHVEEHLSEKTSLDKKGMPALSKKLEQATETAKQAEQILAEKGTEMLQADDKTDPIDIEQLIKDAVAQTMETVAAQNQAAQANSAPQKVVMPAPQIAQTEPVEHQSAPVMPAQPKQAEIKTAQAQSGPSDAELEAAFNEMMAQPVDQAPGQAQTLQASEQKEVPQFMTTGQRQSSLAQVMQDMELFYLERVTR